MRFSRRNLFALLPAAVVASLVPSAKEPGQVDHSAPNKAPVLELGLNQEQPEARFLVSCPGCSSERGQEEEDDDDLLFNFQAFPSEEPCGVSNITLNGLPLTQVWDGTNHASGSGSVASLPRTSLSTVHDLGLEWETSCLEDATNDNRTAAWYDAAQLLTVTIRSVDGRPVFQSAGFTISYKSIVPLELLRLSTTPEPSAGQPEFVRDWQDPPVGLRLTPPTADIETEIKSEQSSLELDEEKLRRLLIEVERLKERIHQERMLRDQHQYLSDLSGDQPPPQCSTLRCYLRNFLHDTKDLIFDTIRMRYHAGPPPPHPYHFHGQRPQHFAGLPPPSTTDMGVSAATPSGAPPKHNRPFPHPEPRRVNALVLTLEIVGAVTIACFAFIAVRKTCCDPRSKSDRRAARAARRTEREYRHAARVFRFKSWWTGRSWTGRRTARDAERITDYEEKRSLVREQERILGNAMEDEERMLRIAHEAVQSIVRSSTASLGSRSPVPSHAGYGYYARPGPPPPPTTNAGWQQVPLRSRSDSLPTYRSEDESSQYSSEPPAYSDDEGEGDSESDIVANGMQYTPSTPSIVSALPSPSSPTAAPGPRRWTPQSSILEISPRQSLETLRSDGTVDRQDFARY